MFCKLQVLVQKTSSSIFMDLVKLLEGARKAAVYQFKQQQLLGGSIPMVGEELQWLEGECKMFLTE